MFVINFYRRFLLQHCLTLVAAISDNLSLSLCSVSVFSCSLSKVRSNYIARRGSVFTISINPSKLLSFSQDSKPSRHEMLNRLFCKDNYNFVSLLSISLLIPWQSQRYNCRAFFRTWAGDSVCHL